MISSFQTPAFVGFDPHNPKPFIAANKKRIFPWVIFDTVIDDIIDLEIQIVCVCLTSW